MSISRDFFRSVIGDVHIKEFGLTKVSIDDIDILEESIFDYKFLEFRSMSEILEAGYEVENEEEWNRKYLSLQDEIGPTEKWFYGKENWTIDSIAYYNSYHFYREIYGVYIKALAFWHFIQDIIMRTGMNFLEARKFGLEIILEHERFHYITELYVTYGEAYNEDPDIYLNYYRNYYERLFSTPECFEETMANHFSKMINSHWEKNQLEYISDFFSRQPDGYKQANQVTKHNQIDYFKKLELQIINKATIGYPYSKILNLIVPLNISKFQNGRWLNIPVYIENDTNSCLNFSQLREFMFPRAKNLLPSCPHFNYLKLSIYDSWHHGFVFDINKFGQWKIRYALPGKKGKEGNVSKKQLSRIVDLAIRKGFFHMEVNTWSTAPRELEISIDDKKHKVVFFREEEINNLLHDIGIIMGFDITKQC